MDTFFKTDFVIKLNFFFLILYKTIIIYLSFYIKAIVFFKKIPQSMKHNLISQLYQLFN